MAPGLTERDVTVVLRDGIPEVWTARAFEKGELVLTPETTSFMDKYWTAGRSALTKNGNALHPDHRNIVLDGRLRSVVSEGKFFTMYFIVTRVKEESGDDINMKEDWTSSSVSVSVEMPCGRKRKFEVKTGADKIAQVPVLFNEKALEKNVKLVCLYDALMSRAEEKPEDSSASDSPPQHPDEEKDEGWRS